MTDEYRGDAELIAAVRSGETEAFDVLYRRHVDAARRMARTLARDASQADDLVAEAFAKLLAILGTGAGPDEAFRPYLLTTIRHTFYEVVRQERRLQVTDDPSVHAPAVPFVDPATEALEVTLISRAFSGLPERWQAVLWHTEVEQERPAKVAPILGLSPNGVAALAYRAREGLRQRYLQEHIATDPGEDCRWAVERLGAFVRGGMARRDQAKIEAHLDECRRCHLLFVELGEVNASLRGVLAPAVLAGSAAAYLSGGKAGAIALWPTIKVIARRRSTQAAAGGAVVAAALVALALALTSQPVPVEPPAAAPPPPPGQPAPPATAAPVPSPTTASPPVVPVPSSALPQTAVDVSIEPVGQLVRGRPGVLALTVANRGAPERAVAFGRTGVVFRRSAAPDTGPLRAVISVPAGITLRAGEPGGDWQCTPSPEGIVCTRPFLSTGQTSRAFVPIGVSASAVDGTISVRLTAPNAKASSASRVTAIQAGGMSATFAGAVAATVQTGGNTLMSCPILSLGCLSARSGGSFLGREDNDDFHMTGYSDPTAPSGAPAGSMRSGASIPVRGEVVWAGLYWSATGTPPEHPQAHLRVPGASRYVPVNAARVDKAANFPRPAYQAWADVTSLVRGSAGGMWWVAVSPDALTTGSGSYGGWALMLVVKDAGPVRTVTVVDGFTPLRDSSASMLVYGARGGPARVAFIAWEGDRGLTGDQLKLDGQALGGDTGDNIAASAANGTADRWNTFGVDARAFDGRTSAGSGQPVLTATATKDAWLLGVVAVEITPRT